MELLKTSHFSELLSEQRTNIMGWATLLVMLLHQTWFMGFPFTIFHGMGHYGVDLFLFVSGFGICRSLQKNTFKAFYKNRICRLLPKCIIAGLMMTGLRLWAWGQDSFSVRGLVSFDLWYIQAIVSLYLISPWLYKGLQKYGMPLFCGLFTLCFALLFLPLDMFPYLLTISRFPAYMLGMMIASGYLVIKEQQIFGSAFFLLSAVLFNLFISHKFGFWYYTFDYLILCFGLPAFVLLLIFCAKLLSVVKFVPVIHWLGIHSLELYLCHECIFGVIRSCGLNEFCSFPLAVVLSILSALLVRKLAVLFCN